MTTPTLATMLANRTASAPDTTADTQTVAGDPIPLTVEEGGTDVQQDSQSEEQGSGIEADANVDSTVDSLIEGEFVVQDEDEARLAKESEAIIESRNGDLPEAGTLYVSHPIQSLSFGPYEFVGGRLTLTDPQEIEKFDKMILKLPPIEQRKIRKIDGSTLDSIVKAHQQSSRMVAGIDSTEGSIGPEAIQQA